MPRMRRYARELPPAVISEQVLRLIDRAIPDDLRNDLTWSVGFGDESIESSSIEEFLSEIAEEERFDELDLEIWNSEVESTFNLWCESGTTSLAYHCSAEQEGALLTFAHAIEGLFQDHRRFKGKIPRVIARPRRIFWSPKFALGAQPASFWKLLDRKRITEDVLSRFVAHGVIGVIAFGLGFGLGRAV